MRDPFRDEDDDKQDDEQPGGMEHIERNSSRTVDGVEWVVVRGDELAVLEAKVGGYAASFDTQHEEIGRLQAELDEVTEEDLKGLADSPKSKPDERHGFKVFGMRLPPKKWAWVNTCVGHLRNQIEDELVAGQAGVKKLKLGQTLLVQSACRHETGAQANNLFMVWCEDPRKKADWMQKCAASATQATQKRDACLRQLGILPALTTKQGRGVDAVSQALAAGQAEEEEE